jgi:hypothetical protein
MTDEVGFGSAKIRHDPWSRGSTEKNGDQIMSKSLIIILALTLGTSFAAPAFAEKSFQANQTTSKAKTNADDGRTLADYNIQKE